MNKYIIQAVTAVLIIVSPLCHSAASEKKPVDGLSDKYFSTKEIKTTKKEDAALAIGKKWEDSDIGNPTAGANGAVRFLFGSTQPSIVCAVLDFCDIELQPGEQVRDVNVGDPRFVIDPAVSGEADNETVHLVISPLEVGLSSKLMVTTNRRTYHFRIRSHLNESMSRITFSYPEDALKKWSALRKKTESVRKEKTIPETGEFLGNLNFDYIISGTTPWKPVRVYNDGKKTIIQMPSSVAQGEVPTLLILRNDAGVFSESEPGLVSYRLHGDRFIVDMLFEKAILILGVGSNQERITITKGN